MNQDSLHKVVIVVLAVALIATLAYAIMLIGSDDESDDPFVGHWYLISYYGYDKDNTYLERNFEDNPEIEMYDLDIYESKDGLFWGMHRTVLVVGVFTGTTFTVGCEVINLRTLENQNLMAHGMLVDDNTMVVLEKIHNLDGSGTEAWFSVLTKDRTMSDVGECLELYTGLWDVQYSMTLGNAEEIKLLGDKFQITEQKGCTFRGTMEQMNFEGDIVDVDLKGVMFPIDYVEIGYTAYLFDDNGHLWKVRLRDNTLYLVTLTHSENSTMNIMECALRVYTNDGSSARPLWAPLNVEGMTWRMVSSDALYTNGDRVVWDIPYTIHVVKQNECQFTGTWTIGDKTGECSFYMNETGKVITVSSSTNYGDRGTMIDDMDISIGFISSDGKRMELYEMYREFDNPGYVGLRAVSYTVFELVEESELSE